VRIWRLLFISAAIFFLIVSARATAGAAELVMFESAGCSWCEKWDAEIAPIYPKTRESRIAPLRRVDLDDDLPADLKGLKAVIYTPTFVLLHRGREIGRILGYPGEDFFWALLDELMVKLAAVRNQKVAACRNNAVAGKVAPGSMVC
jgi:hypothetical protein